MSHCAGGAVGTPLANKEDLWTLASHLKVAKVGVYLYVRVFSRRNDTRGDEDAALAWQAEGAGPL